MNTYSKFTYTHYVGAHAWGEFTDEQNTRLNEEFEARIASQFPGMEIRTTLDPYRVGVICPRERCDEAAEIELDISDIAEDVLALAECSA